MTLFYVLFIHLFCTSISAETTPEESLMDPLVAVKSVLNKSEDKVLINITLSEEVAVGFEMLEVEGKIIHLWHDQVLKAGRHDLALPLPVLTEHKYVLVIKAGDQITKHLILKGQFPN